MLKQVTKEQYWQVTGLLTLAKATMDRANEIEASLREILKVNTDDEGKSGLGDPQHIGDAVYSPYTPDLLLTKLGITTKEK